MVIIKLKTLQYHRDISMIHYYNTITRDEKLKIPFCSYRWYRARFASDKKKPTNDMSSPLQDFRVAGWRSTNTK